MAVLSFLLAVIAANPRSTAEGEPGDATTLLRRVAQGDRAAYQALYALLSSQALGLALRVLGSRSEAEDSLQETFFDVWTRAAQFDAARGSGRAWVLSMVRNRAIDRLRTRGAVSRMIDRAETQSTTPPVITPADELVKSEAQTSVKSAMSELTDQQRHAIELAFYEGLSQSEIAEKLGEPLGTVKSRVRAAMEKLSRLIPRDHGPRDRGQS